MISQDYYENLSLPFVELSDELTLSILTEITEQSQQLIENPENINEQRILEHSSRETKEFQEQSTNWAFSAMVLAYLKGMSSIDADLNKLGSARDAGRAIIATQSFAPQDNPIYNISSNARRNIPEKHWPFYRPFENAIKSDIDNLFEPVVRRSRDIYRQIVTETLLPAFRNGDTATRRDLTQQLLNKFADNGIDAIHYRNGRRVSIEAYAEMVSRTYTGRSAMQANVNRYYERGYELVRMSYHTGSSPMCEPWQGNVYSLSESEKYTSLQTAIDGGAFHPNCLHSLSAYIPGVSGELDPSIGPEEKKLFDKYGEGKANEIIYKAKQQQRYNERQIRKWKKREAVALDDSTSKKAKSKISEWQAKQRELISENPYLRRKYEREQV